MVNAEKWRIVTGSQAKYETLQLAITQAKIDVDVELLPCPQPIHELHGPLHTSSKYLYADKILKTWTHSRGGLEGDIGVGNDVCPKVKIDTETQYRHTLFKYHKKKGKNIGEMGYGDRLDALSWYIALAFVPRKHHAIDLRQSIGVGVFNEKHIFGNLIQKIYTHFPTNPLPSNKAIRESLVYAAENHISVGDGSRDNKELEVSSAAAGGILPISLLEWYLRTNLNAKVVVGGLGTNPQVVEIEMLGRGFTSHMVSKMHELSRGKKKGVETAQALAINATIPITKGGHCTVVWSRDEGKCVVA